MNAKLFYLLNKAIQDVIYQNCEDDLWDGYIHPTLAKEMATAAAQVFDASMAGQAYAKTECDVR